MVDSHGRGIAVPNFWRCRRGAPHSHLSPSSTQASTLPRRRKRSSFSQRAVSRTAAARPRALHPFDRRTVYLYSNTQTDHKRTASAVGQQKRSEL